MELEAAEAAAAAGSRSSSGKKKYKLNKKQFIKFLICIFLAIALLITAYATIVIIKAPKIETNNIYSLLSQSSILYDDSGQIIDNVFADENRTIVSIDQIPNHVQKAFIALEDKTFEKHHGFNIIRIFGAIKDAIFNVTEIPSGDAGDCGSPGDIAGKAKAEAISTIVRERENTNQKLIDFYNKVYNDLKAQQFSASDVEKKIELINKLYALPIPEENIIVDTLIDRVPSLVSTIVDSIGTEILR